MDHSLTTKSYSYLREKLSRGEIEPGSQLVNRALAEEIGVSVIPVREAINRLASEGLVKRIPGAGAFVLNPSRQDLDQLYVLRDALESCAASEAARNVTDEQIEEFEYLLERMQETAKQVEGQSKGYSSKKQWDRWLDDEKQFHDLLVETSRNEILARVIHDNLAIRGVFEAQRNSPRLLTAEVASLTCKFKAELLDALRKRDSNRAREVMSEQIQRGRKTVIEFLKQQERGV